MDSTRFMEDRANWKWNTTHPMEWPRPPRKMPRWWNIWGYASLRDTEEVFGLIDQSDLDRFWAEHAKGQSVYEDAGGYLIRCYSALMGEDTEEPYTYAQAAADLMAGRS